MDSQVEEVKSKIDIVSLISGYVALKRTGRNYRGLCPFHGEKTPSFMVSQDRQIYKCFGCGEGGDSLSFYQKIEGVEFGEALRNLAKQAGVILKEYKPTGAERQKERFLEINRLAGEFYHYLLIKHPTGREALKYLQTRGLSIKTISQWQLGFAPDKWDSLFKFLQKKGFDPKEIITSGLSLPSSGKGIYDRFRKRIIFPIRNIQGHVVGFSGRIFGEGEPKYLNSPENNLFNKSSLLFGLDLAKSEIKRQNQAVLVEGNVDVIFSHQVGVQNVVCPLGTALTEKQLSLLRRFSENLVLSFDSDQAGITASKRALELAETAGFTVKMVLFDEKDPDELIKKNPTLWKKSLKNSVAAYDYFLEKTMQNFGTGSPEQIKQITKEILPLVSKIENEITRAHYLRLIASKLNVDEESVRLELKKIQKKEQNSTQPNEEKSKTDQSILEKYLLSLIIQSNLVPQELSEIKFANVKLGAFAQLIENSQENGSLNSKKLFETLPEEIKEEIDQIIFNELDENILNDQEKIEKEIKTCVVRLKELNLRARLKKISIEIRQAELLKQSDKINSLTQHFNEVSQKLSQLEKEN